MMTREEHRERKKKSMCNLLELKNQFCTFNCSYQILKNSREKASMRTQDTKLYSQYLSSFTNDRMILQLYGEGSSLCIRAGEKVG